MKRSRFRIPTILSMLLALLAAGGVSGHHSWTSEYDANKAVTVTGVITKVEWTNPHVHIYLDSKDDDGKVTAWNFEMASVLSLERGGWSRRTVNPGDVLTVEGFGGRAVTERAIASAIRTSDGRSLFVGMPQD